MSTSKRKRARRDPGPPRLPLWRVTILAHDIPLRWSIPASVIECGASTPGVACEAAVRLLHIDAGVPALRSMIALSVEYARADPVRSHTARSEAA